MRLKAVLGFLPLIVFVLVGHLVGDDTVGWVALASAALAIGVAARDGRDGVTPISVSSTLVLAVLGVTALVGGDQAASTVSTYGTGILALIVGVTMLATAATVPFTEQSARASVPSQYWGSPTFRALNRRVSTAWGIATIGCGVSRFVYVAAFGPDPTHTTASELLLAFGVPALLCYVAFSYGNHVVKAARAKVRTA